MISFNFFKAAQQISDGSMDVNTATKNIPELERLNTLKDRQAQ